MSMLKDSERVIATILKDFETSSANMKAFEKLADLYRTNPDEVSTERALAACAKSLRHLNDVNRRMLLLLLVYASGGSYETDTAKVLIKLGRGEDALREMMRKKMGGQ
ncbi:hypothetical protein [Paraburkholderia sp. MM6662-R1]|uniref:hypothetical protein n=1 Tax=Paraburkholderia sp. MM6662-R1 TaxID=2991066 RepID=UPI003D19C6FE